LVLIAGFMVLSQSPFKLNADMGLLTAITIGFALLADFLFLPPLLMKVEK
jgi:predicted RND superfamily exporter protein